MSMKRKLGCLMLVSVLVSVPVFSSEIVGLSEVESKLNLSRVQKQITLVESASDSSSLRVGVVMLDSGGSTDISPKGYVYLTLFNESEMKDVSSLHLISHANELVSARRIESGVYEVVVKKFDEDVTKENTVEIRIEARKLTQEVKNLGNDEFGYQHILTPVTTSEEIH